VSTEAPDPEDDRPPKRPVRDHVYEVSPRDAVDEYLSYKREEIRETTVRNYHKNLKFFIEWSEQIGLDSMCDMGGYDFKEFADWRKTDGNYANGSLSPKTYKESQKTLKRFIRWCEQTEYIRRGVSEQVQIPSITSNRPDQTIDYQSVRKMVEFADKFHYASVQHVVCLLYAETGARTGGLRALDICHFEYRGNQGVLKFRDDPENEVRLKNGENGERDIDLSPYCCDVISDYIEHKRNDTVDEFGREPLLVARDGRIGKSTLKKYVYELSRPCVIEGLCPSGLDPDSCPGRVDRAHKCEDNVSPKAIRKAYITHLKKEGVKNSDISYRCNVCSSVMDEHYNQMSLDEKRRNQSDKIKRIARKGCSITESAKEPKAISQVIKSTKTPV